MSYQNKFPDLLVEKENSLLWITLNRPDFSNAFSTEMIHSLTGVLKLANFDDEIRVIIITGAGKAFCAGGDIKDMESKAGMFAGDSNKLRELYMNGIQQIPLTMNQMQKPIIAMVNGAAIGAGCDFSCMCDIRVASSRAKFGETFSKLSLVPGDGGTFFLQRVVGLPKAMEMFFTGDIYSSEEAYNIGLANFIVEESELKNKTKELALKIASNAPVAIKMTKKALYHASTSSLEAHLDLLAAFQGISQRTSDHFEGIAAFREKRNPTFTGK